MDQLSFLEGPKDPEPWPNALTRYPFVALINGVERIYSEPPREKSLAEKLRAASVALRAREIPRSR